MPNSCPSKGLLFELKALRDVFQSSRVTQSEVLLCLDKEAKRPHSLCPAAIPSMDQAA
jgi:hypothetical protein